MSVEKPGVSDMKPVAAVVITSMKILGATVPPLAARFLELTLEWMINDAQKEAFSFAADALQATSFLATGTAKVTAALREIAAQSGNLAEKAKSEIASLGKPS